MDPNRKRAYRCLLYSAMLEIRQLAWIRIDPSPLMVPEQPHATFNRVHRAGVVADWLHNLALFSALDFEHFDEDRFWRDLEGYQQQHSDLELAAYRRLFDQELSAPGSGYPF
jgi:hypothetical protein